MHADIDATALHAGIDTVSSTIYREYKMVLIIVYNCLQYNLLIIITNDSLEIIIVDTDICPT